MRVILQKNTLMNFDFSLFFRALGLAIVLESLFWSISPQSMRQVMTLALEKNNNELRNMGVLGIIAGLLVIWLFGS